MTESRPLFVGEHNPYGDDDKYALYPFPDNSAGGRLCYRILGFKLRKDYIYRCDRVNLCKGKWGIVQARQTADELQQDRPIEDVFVLLGSKVCQAFGAEYDPLSQRLHAGRQIVVLPHPSGLNRFWNEDGAFERAREALRAAGVLAAVGLP